MDFLFRQAKIIRQPCFAGLVDGSVFIISTLGVHNTDSHQLFMDGYVELRRRFPSSKLICLGDKVTGMDSDICFVPFEESFGNADRYNDYWQPSMINWDMSLALGGDC